MASTGHEFVPGATGNSVTPASGEHALPAQELHHSASKLRSESRTTKLVYIGLIVLTILCSGYTAFKGVDCGQHWDEGNFIETIVNSFQTKTLLPNGWYDYGSVPYTLTMIPSISTAVKHYRTSGERVTDTSLTAFAPFARQEWFKLKLRREFIVISLATLVWVALLGWRITSRWQTAAFATMFTASSWEFMYHARWIAADLIMVQFAILSLLLMYVAMEKYNRTALWLSAVAGGLALGSKYPGGLLIIPLLCACWIASRGQELRQRVYQALKVTTIFFAVFILSTPGTILQTFWFIRSVGFQMHHYGTWHGGYTVSTGQHARLILIYLATVAMSKYRLIATAISLLSITGAIVSWRELRWKSLPILGFAAMYAVYFSRQHVMIVRNLMVLVPIIAIFGAVGWTWLVGKIRAVPLRVVANAAAVSAVIMSLSWQIQAAHGIANRRDIDHRANVARYLQTDMGRRSFITSRVAASYGNSASFEVPLDKAEYVLFTNKEVSDWTRLSANVPGRYTMVSSIEECDFDYYPSWPGDERLIAVPKATAYELGVVN